MKKWLTRMLVVVAVLTLSVFCLTACGDGKGDGKIEGVYKNTAMIVSGQTEKVPSGLQGTLELKEDGTWELASPGVDQTVSGTWTVNQDGNEIVLKIGTMEYMTGTVSNGKLELTIADSIGDSVGIDMVYIYKK